MEKLSLTIAERLMDNCCPEPNTGCWLWTAGVSGQAYGSVSINGKDYRAHRLSYETWIGPIQAGLCDCHKCDTPLCINPDHLFLGTPADNNADRDRKGRHKPSGVKGDLHWAHRRPDLRATGERHGMSILDETTVRAIRRRLATGEHLAAIASTFRVGISTIVDIKKGRTWTGVRDE